VRALLGLEARDGHLILQPEIPDEIGRIFVAGANAFGRRWDLEATGRNGHVRLANR
jgi:hypothetical protein